MIRKISTGYGSRGRAGGASGARKIFKFSPEFYFDSLGDWERVGFRFPSVFFRVWWEKSHRREFTEGKRTRELSGQGERGVEGGREWPGGGFSPRS